MLVTGARAPVALDIARAGRAAGWRVHLADTVACTAARWARPRFPVHRLPGPRGDLARFGAALRRLVEERGITLVVPTCEEVFYVAAVAERLPARVFAPDLPTLRRLHSKVEFIALAAAAGLPVPATRRITSRDGLAGLALDATVLKPEFSRFAAATLVRPDAATVARIAPTPAHPWVAQAFVAGEELCLWSAVEAGRVSASVTYRPRRRWGRSAAFAFEAVRCSAAEEVAARIAAATGMTGHLSFDLIIDHAGRAVPIECNPRAVSGVHLFDANPALARALLGEPAPSPPAGRQRHLAAAMALLGMPAALGRGEAGALLADWRAGADAVGRPGDRGPMWGSLVDAARFAALGLTRRRSPTRQTTADIEWNGEPMR